MCWSAIDGMVRVQFVEQRIQLELDPLATNAGFKDRGHELRDLPLEIRRGRRIHHRA